MKPHGMVLTHAQHGGYTRLEINMGETLISLEPMHGLCSLCLRAGNCLLITVANNPRLFRICDGCKNLMYGGHNPPDIPQR